MRLANRYPANSRNRTTLRIEKLEARNLLTASFLDPSFGEEGIVVADPLWRSDTEEGTRDIIVQTDGKLVVLGNSDLDGRNVIVRYNADGTLDESFGLKGRSIIDTNEDRFTFRDRVPKKLAQDSQGRILVGGEILMRITPLPM